jgi:hypothetical protein
MALNDIIKNATVVDMQRCEAIFLSFNSLSHYFERNHDTVKLLYDNNILTDKDIDLVLEEKVLNEAKIYVDMMGRELTYIPGGETTRSQSYADHVLRTDFLAYALAKKALSNKEISKITFDHGENLDSFVQRYGKNDLIPSLRNELLNPKPKPEIKYDEHPTCSMMH